MTHHEMLFAALVILQIADAALTIAGLRTGYAKEANPLVEKLIGKVGRDRAIVGIKLIAIAGLWYGYALVPLWALGAGVALYVAVVANNVRVLRNAKAREAEIE